MNIFRLQILRIAAIVLVVCPFLSQAEPSGARLSPSEAIRIARHAAKRAGRHLGDYKQPEAHYEYTRKDHSWFVFFDGRVPMPGNHFSVSINDRAGTAVVRGGE